MHIEPCAAIDLLREYLDRTGFQQIYKFIASAHHYGAAPSLVARSTAGEIARFFDTVLTGQPHLHLLQCLISGRPARRNALTRVEIPAAEALLRAGILEESGGDLEAGPYQLISAFGLDLLIDRRIHFGGSEVHEVYIGPDSYLMLYYIDTGRLRRTDRALDLCTGTGIGALYLSLFSDQVVATDIGDAPLKLIGWNRQLNGRAAQVEVRRQELSETLRGGETFDVLTCNPPFVAFPPGLKGTLYAHGPDVDGLGYMRTIIAHLPRVLNPGGSAYLVADLPGDTAGPYFQEELEMIAGSLELSADMYIDYVSSADERVAPLSVYLERLNPGHDRAEISHGLARFQTETLRASRYYMTTVRLRQANAAGGGSPGVRLMRRYEPARRRVDGIPAEAEWPKILLHT